MYVIAHAASKPGLLVAGVAVAAYMSDRIMRHIAKRHMACAGLMVACVAVAWGLAAPEDEDAIMTRLLGDTHMCQYRMIRIYVNI